MCVCVQARMKENEREGMVDGVGKEENSRKDTAFEKQLACLLARLLADVRASAHSQAKKYNDEALLFLHQKKTQPKQTKVNLWSFFDAQGKWISKKNENSKLHRWGQSVQTDKESESDGELQKHRTRKQNRQRCVDIGRIRTLYFKICRELTLKTVFFRVVYPSRWE